MKTIEIDEEWLRQKYLVEDMSIKDVGDLIGCSSGPVWRTLKKYGISKEVHYLPLYRDEQWLREHFIEKKLSPSQIASICNVDPNTILYWLHEFGIEPRGKKELWKHDWVLKVKEAIELVEKTDTFGELAECLSVKRRNLQYHCSKLITTIQPGESIFEAFRREVLSGEITTDVEITCTIPTCGSGHCSWCGKRIIASNERKASTAVFCNNSCSMAFTRSNREIRPTWTAWDEHFFDELTPDGAYILGLIIADGHITDSISGRGTRQYVVGLHQKYPQILECIAEILEFEGSLADGGNSPCTRLVLGSKHAWEVLTNVYKIPAGKQKSYNVCIPEVILEDKVCLPHFIRGLFDGDGYVAKKLSHFGLSSGSEKLIEDFNNVLVSEIGLSSKEKNWEKGGYKKVDGTQSGCWYIRWTSAEECMAFAKYIYGPTFNIYGSILYLERKKELFMRFFVPWRSKAWLEEEIIEKGRSCTDIAHDFDDVSSLQIGAWASKFDLKTTLTQLCEYCGEAFEAKHEQVDNGGGRFCSLTCRHGGKEVTRRPNRLPITVSCLYCGENFITAPASVENGRRFCGWECAGLAKSAFGRVSVLCEVCGQVFEVTRSKFMIGEGKFCSVSCMKDWQAAQREKKFCVVCNKEFEVTSSQIIKGGGRFCSIECRRVWYPPQTMKKKTCVICKETFETLRDEQRFCSRECKWLGQRKRALRVCKHCGKEFEIQQCYIRKGGGHFCSKECSDKAHVKKEERVCKMCGVAFLAKFTSVQRGEGKYCSNECKHTARSLLNTVTIQCQLCGIPFNVGRSIFGRRKFCSMECYRSPKPPITESYVQLSLHETGAGLEIF